MFPPKLNKSADDDQNNYNSRPIIAVISYLF